MSLRIAVLCGGMSAEREVSLKSGRAVQDALTIRGYSVKGIDVGRALPAKLKASEIDMAFIALHGKLGEDGTVQGLLEFLDIPYTGSGVLASALAMDKIAAKRVLMSGGVPTPRFAVFRRPDDAEDLAELADEILGQFDPPLVVKAPDQGSSLGVTIAEDRAAVMRGLQEAFKYGSRAMVEEFISGVEITAGLLGNRNPQVLPLIEIVSETGRYDYESKYTAGLSRHIIPPRIPAGTRAEVSRLAAATFDLIGCRGFARVDFIVADDGRPYVLEVNTIPGLTAVSLFPDAARAAGIEMPQLCETLMGLAQEHYDEAGGMHD